MLFMSVGGGIEGVLGVSFTMNLMATREAVAKKDKGSYSDDANQRKVAQLIYAFQERFGEGMLL